MSLCQDIKTLHVLIAYSIYLQSVSLQPIVDTIEFWHKGAYFWLKSRNDTKLESHGRLVPDIYLDIYCFTWNLSISM